VNVQEGVQDALEATSTGVLGGEVEHWEPEVVVR